METYNRVFHIMVSIGLLFISLKILGGGTENSFYILHNINLIFHEAGHTIFGLFGEFVGFLGGMLGQLLIPLIFVIYFFRKNALLSSLIMLWWFGENFLDLAPYVGDARTQSTLLIGGDHDFAYLLGKLNLLEFNKHLENLFLTIGFLIMTTSIVVIAKIAFKTYERVEERV